MKVIEFPKLQTTSFAISDISVMHRSPKWDDKGAPFAGGRRVRNGFVLVDKGGLICRWKNNTVKLRRGGLIYLPAGTLCYTDIDDPPLLIYCINFYLTDPKDNERIIFSRDPWYITDNAPARLFELCNNMSDCIYPESNVFKSISYLTDFFNIVLNISRSKSQSRITPALQYINSHYTEDIDIDTLASLCFVSKSHLSRLFRHELGIPPLKYRDNLRIERAKALLSDGEFTVGEIAAMLGYNGTYYFSRAFKKSMGIPPSLYASSGRKKLQ